MDESYMITIERYGERERESTKLTGNGGEST